MIADGTLTFTAPASATLRRAVRRVLRGVRLERPPSAGNDYEIRGNRFGVSQHPGGTAGAWARTAMPGTRTRERCPGPPQGAVPLIEINGDAVVQANGREPDRPCGCEDGNGKIPSPATPRSSIPSLTSYTSTDTLPEGGPDHHAMPTLEQRRRRQRWPTSTATSQLLSDADTVTWTASRSTWKPAPTRSGCG